VKSSGKQICLLFDPEDGGGTFFRNFGWLSTDMLQYIPEDSVLAIVFIVAKFKLL
jgi:hypothetical protein